MSDRMNIESDSALIGCGDMRLRHYYEHEYPNSIKFLTAGGIVYGFNESLKLLKSQGVEKIVLATHMGTEDKGECGAIGYILGGLDGKIKIEPLVNIFLVEPFVPVKAEWNRKVRAREIIPKNENAFRFYVESEANPLMQKKFLENMGFSVKLETVDESKLDRSVEHEVHTLMLMKSHVTTWSTFESRLPWGKAHYAVQVPVFESATRAHVKLFVDGLNMKAIIPVLLNRSDEADLFQFRSSLLTDSIVVGHGVKMEQLQRPVVKVR